MERLDRSSLAVVSKIILVLLLLIPLNGVSAPVELGDKPLDFVSPSRISYFQENGEEVSFETVSSPAYENLFVQGVGALGSSFECPGST